MGKTTYTLTHLRTAWHVHRYDEEADHIFNVLTDIPSKAEALTIAMREAEQHRPSEIMCIGASGIRSIIASFS